MCSISGFVTFSAYRHTVLADIDPDFTLRSEKIAQEWRDLSPEEKSFWHEKANNEFASYKHQIGTYDTAQQMQLEQLHRTKKLKTDHSKLPMLDKPQLLNTLAGSLNVLERTKQALEENILEARKLPDLPEQWTTADIDFLKNSYALAQSVSLVLNCQVADTRTTLLQAQPILVNVSVPLVRSYLEHDMPHVQELTDGDDLRHHTEHHHLHTH